MINKRFLTFKYRYFVLINFNLHPIEFRLDYDLYSCLVPDIYICFCISPRRKRKEI